jgi:hypothetical protein
VISTQHAPYYNSGENIWTSGSKPHGHYGVLKAITHNVVEKAVVNQIIKPLIGDRFEVIL